MPGAKLQSKYRCGSEGSVNNGLKKSCNFEFVFEDGTHHCPLCGTALVRVPNGKTVSELLREGQRRQER